MNLEYNALGTEEVIPTSRYVAARSNDGIPNSGSGVDDAVIREMATEVRDGGIVSHVVAAYHESGRLRVDGSVDYATLHREITGYSFD